MTKSCAEVDKCNIHTEDKLDQWLGAEIDIDEADIGSKSVRATRDPKCRFMYAHY
jgi:hypothetical protein